MNAKAKKPSKAPVPAPVEMIERQILYIRGQRVIIDNDLAELYHVTTGNLNLAVRRNIRRFPSDFMFRLTAAEAKGLLLQTATSHKALGTKLEKVEATQRQHASVIRSVVDELDRLKEPPPLPIKRRIGFAVQQNRASIEDLLRQPIGRDVDGIDVGGNAVQSRDRGYHRRT